ncbi:MAG: hypothetical protein IOC80_11055 [Rhodobacter sp.]|nr:hypothetical protein [Rhodobacter sp.]MCA3515097.1 hypothetical protein [Rhodobacter sp.]MCA3521376.1 hypothetical protein [Rhodobacter sp.]MCA3521909.1 hypothetical protein [Rhodobacter sp.]MCA3526888.1 hypothetical protein [Rhodobacter sp.]
MSEYKPFAFVLMPFSDDFLDTYQLVIKKLCVEKGIIAERVDEQYYSENILERIYRQIENCDFIIADMSGKNANVFYEVGYAHAKDKLCILCAKTTDSIPFDLKHHNHVIYGDSLSTLEDRLSAWLDWAKDETKKRKKETISVSVSVVNEILKKSEYHHTGSFDLLVNMRNISDHRSPEIETIYIKTSNDWSLTCHNKPCPSELDNGTNIKRNVLIPSIRRLSAGAFYEERVTFNRTFWSKYNGAEQKEIYRCSGTLIIEIVTEKSTWKKEVPLTVEFDEIPF